MSHSKNKITQEELTYLLKNSRSLPFLVHRVKRSDFEKEQQSHPELNTKKIPDSLDDKEYISFGIAPILNGIPDLVERMFADLNKNHGEKFFNFYEYLMDTENDVFQILHHLSKKFKTLRIVQDSQESFLAIQSKQNTSSITWSELERRARKEDKKLNALRNAPHLDLSGFEYIETDISDLCYQVTLMDFSSEVSKPTYTSEPHPMLLSFSQKSQSSVMAYYILSEIYLYERAFTFMNDAMRTLKFDIFSTSGFNLSIGSDILFNPLKKPAALKIPKQAGDKFWEEIANIEQEIAMMPVERHKVLSSQIEREMEEINEIFKNLMEGLSNVKVIEKEAYEIALYLIEQRRVLNGISSLRSNVSLRYTELNIALLLGNIYSKGAETTKLRLLIAYIKRILEITNSKDFTIQFHLGIWLASISAYSEAERYFQNYIDKNPSDSAGKVEILRVLVKQKKYKEILEMVKMNPQLEMEEQRLGLTIGSILIEQRGYQLAREWMVRTSTSSTDSKTQKYYLLTKASYLLKDYENAMKYSLLLKETSLPSLQIDILELQGLISGTSVSKLPQAIEYLKKANDARANNQKTILLLGHFQFLHKKYEEAQELLCRAYFLEKGQKLDVLLQAQFNLKDFDRNSSDAGTRIEKVIVSLLGFLEKSPNSELAISLLGSAYLKAQNFSAAIEMLSRCLDLETKELDSLFDLPLSAEQLMEVRFELAQAQEGVGQTSVAFETMKSLVGKQTSSLKLSRSMYAFLAELHYKNNDLSEALRLLTLHVVYAKNATAQEFLLYAKVKLREGKKSEVQTYLLKCLAIDPNLVEAQVLNALLQENANVNEAVEKLQESFVKNPAESAIILKNLAQLFIQENKVKEFDEIIARFNQFQVEFTSDIIAMSATNQLRQNKPESALKLLEDGLEKYPNDVTLLIGLAQYHAFIKSLENSNNSNNEEIAIYQRILSDPSLVISEEKQKYVKSQLAESLMISGSFTQAQEIYGELILRDESSNRNQHIYAFAVCELSQGNFAGGIVSLKKLYAKDRTSKHVMLLLALAFTRCNEFEAASQMYKKCLDLYPNFLRAAINFSILHRTLKDYRDSEILLISMKRHFPQNLELDYHLALTFIAAKSPSQALTVLKDMIKEFPEREKITLQQLTSQQQQLHQVNSYIDAYGFSRLFHDEVSKKKRQDGIILKKQHQHHHHHHESQHNDYQNGFLKQMEGLLIYEPKKNVDFVQFNLLLAQTLRKSRQADEAVRHLEFCINSDQDNVHYCYSLALSQFMRGNLQQSMYEIARCKELDAKNSAVYSFALSNMLHRARYFFDEIGVLEGCVKENPEFYEAICNLASMYIVKGRVIEAVELFGKAVKLRPLDPSVHFNYANSLMLSRQNKLAIEQYQECLELSPNNEQCMYNLGLLYQQENQISQAILYFEQCLTINPFSSESIYKKLQSLYKFNILTASVD